MSRLREVLQDMSRVTWHTKHLSGYIAVICLAGCVAKKKLPANAKHFAHPMAQREFRRQLCVRKLFSGTYAQLEHTMKMFQLNAH